MAWIVLVTAGLLEVCWAVSIRFTDGFTRPLPSALTLVALVSSLLLLSIAVRTVPVSVAYPVWVGVGALGTMTVGIIALDEPWTPASLFFAAVLGIGIIGLQMTAPTR